MKTTNVNQLPAWATTRYGLLLVRIDAIHLNKSIPTIEWSAVAADWKQQWSGRERKAAALKLSEQHSLSLLTLYLGDGCRHPEALTIAVGNNKESKPKRLVPEVIAAAYECGYGKLLDAIRCEKWLMLKKLTPQEDPVHAEFAGYRFWLIFGREHFTLRARCLLKSEEAANTLARALARAGVQARVRVCTQGERKYWLVELSGREILKLAERYESWRSALELAEKKGALPNAGKEGASPCTQRWASTGSICAGVEDPVASSPEERARARKRLRGAPKSSRSGALRPMCTGGARTGAWKSPGAGS